MDICIIGSGGFLSGKLIAFALQANGFVSVVGRRVPENAGDISFTNIDLLSQQLPVENLLQYDAIIYAAGVGIQSGVQVKGEDMFYLNTFIPISLVGQLEQKGFQGKLVTFGSYFEIGSTTDFNKQYDEEAVVFSPLQVPNKYCLSKRLLSRYFFQMQLPFTYYHCILPTIYGMGENNKRLIPYLINSLISNTPVQLSAGNQVRQYLLADDAVAILFDMLNASIPAGVYNFPAAETVTVKEIAATIYSAFQQNVDNAVFGKAQRNDEFMKVLQLDAANLSAQINLPPLTLLKNYISQTNNTPWH